MPTPIVGHIETLSIGNRPMSFLINEFLRSFISSDRAITRRDVARTDVFREKHPLPIALRKYGYFYYSK